MAVDDDIVINFYLNFSLDLCDIWQTRFVFYDKWDLFFNITTVFCDFNNRYVLIYNVLAYAQRACIIPCNFSMIIRATVLPSLGSNSVVAFWQLNSLTAVFVYFQQDGGYAITSVCLSVCLSVCKITAKVIGRFHWNLVLWLGLTVGGTE